MSQGQDISAQDDDFARQSITPPAPILMEEQPLAAAGMTAQSDHATKLVKAGGLLWQKLLGSRSLEIREAKQLMGKIFGGTDAKGKWLWKDFYEVQEIAFIHLLHEFGGRLQSFPETVGIWRLHQILDKTLTHTKRTEESVALQQFSTPPPLAYLAALCGRITSMDTVLEPSAGTGLLAKFTETFGARLILNEIDERRSNVLGLLFPEAEHFRHDAEQIHDYLPDRIQPTVVIMNPPFSATIGVKKRNPDALPKHVRSAFQRLAPGGRMVLISAHWFSPLSEDWKGFFEGLKASIPVTAVIPGDFYYKHGTTIKTRLTVIDKVEDTSTVTHEVVVTPKYQRIANSRDTRTLRTFTDQDIQAILEKIPERKVPVIREIKPEPKEEAPAPRKTKSREKQYTPFTPPKDIVPVIYKVNQRESIEDNLSQLYEEYIPQSITIHGAKPHPTKLCESAALASVTPPVPTYIPKLPERLITERVLSFAQLESVVYAGEAHSKHLQGYFTVSDNLDDVEAAGAMTPNAVQFRQGWFLGDGTGAGKGRQIAGIILSNFLDGRTKALWVSKSDKLLEDAKRDWVALGGDESQVVSLSRFKVDADITLTEGILFCTYATLRTAAKQGKQSRLSQVVKYLGQDFDGVIAFDEAHTMGNAIDEKGEIFVKEASQQGKAGLRLQNALPDARVVYVSATGATKVSNLAYASRLGLWQSGAFPFATRDEFISSIEDAGVAAMEVVCRDLKALGLYLSRSLSFDGVEYRPLEITLSPEQIQIYNTYAEAFKVIHHSIQDALQACNVVSESSGTLNRAAKMSAHSQFESGKQRFFNHLLTSMKCPQMVCEMENDLRNGNAVVVQLVTTNEAIIDRRIKELPVEEWGDLNIDITPREYVMNYLKHSFPTTLYKVYSDTDGKTYSEMVVDTEGNAIRSKEAEEMKEALLDMIASLPPLPGALEHILFHFGHDQVSEITGRSVRILKNKETGQIYVQNRSASASLTETQSFMDGEKLILVFSDAGGTGKSYHADLGAMNKQRRVHYLLESGWRADNAIQGLGRSHRTNQASAPVFRPVVTDVRGERRFISTIAKRLDSLGALTRGQRQTGGQGLFDPKDNLESKYAEASLDRFFHLLHAGQVEGFSLAEFEDATGLRLTTNDGNMLLDLPPISQFLNRMLALPIEQQNQLFEFFESILQGKIEEAVAAGTYEDGVETLKAERFTVISKQVLYTHSSGSNTYCVEIESLKKREIRSSRDAELINGGMLCINERSGRAGVVFPTSSTVGENGAIVTRVGIARPTEVTRVPVADFQKSNWVKVSRQEWLTAWDGEVASTPEFKEERFFLITGLLLPIWKSLDQSDLRVYRLKSDDGEVHLGRVIKPEHMELVAKVLNLSQTELRPSEIYRLIMDDHKNHQLSAGIYLKRSSIMDEWRIEVTGSLSDGLIKQLVADGCFTEIVNWRKRVFIPTGEDAALPVIERVRDTVRGY